MRIITLSILLLGSVVAFSQDESTLTAPRALFKVAPQNFAVNTLKVGTEIFNKTLTKSYCLYLYARYDGNSGPPLFYYSDDFYKGLGGEFQYRKYISGIKNYQTRRGKKYLQGIYAAGYLNAGIYSNKGQFNNSYYNYNTGQSVGSTIYIDDSVVNYGTGFTIGFHRTFWSVLFFDTYFGGGFQLSNVERNFNPSIPMSYYYSSYSGITAPGYQGIMPKFGVQVGVAL